jgi:hypothetical protein
MIAYQDGKGFFDTEIEMNLRDYFAAKAMQAMLGWKDLNNVNISYEAYMMADAMMEVRNASI